MMLGDVDLSGFGESSGGNLANPFDSGAVGGLSQYPPGPTNGHRSVHGFFELSHEDDNFPGLWNLMCGGGEPIQMDTEANAPQHLITPNQRQKVGRGT